VRKGWGGMVMMVMGVVVAVVVVMSVMIVVAVVGVVINIDIVGFVATCDTSRYPAAAARRPTFHQPEQTHASPRIAHNHAPTTSPSQLFSFKHPHSHPVAACAAAAAAARPTPWPPPIHCPPQRATCCGNAVSSTSAHGACALACGAPRRCFRGHCARA